MNPLLFMRVILLFLMSINSAQLGAAACPSSDCGRRERCEVQDPSPCAATAPTEPVRLETKKSPTQLRLEHSPKVNRVTRADIVRALRQEGPLSAFPPGLVELIGGYMPLQLLMGPVVAVGSLGVTIWREGRLYRIQTDIEGLKDYLNEKSGIVIPKLVPVPARGLLAQFATGGMHTALLFESGEVFTAGYGNYGQLGHTIPGDPCRWTGYRQLIPRDATVDAVYAGRIHSFFVTDDNRIFVAGGSRKGSAVLSENRVQQSTVYELKDASGKGRIKEVSTTTNDNIVVLYENGLVAVADGVAGSWFVMAKGPLIDRLKMPLYAVDKDGAVVALKRSASTETEWTLSPTAVPDLAVMFSPTNGDKVADFYTELLAAVALYKGKCSYAVEAKKFGREPFVCRYENIEPHEMPHSLYADSLGRARILAFPDDSLSISFGEDPRQYPIRFETCQSTTP